MGLRTLACTLLVLVVSFRAAGEVEKLGQPCRAKQVLGGCIVTDRQDGRDRLVLLNDNETYGCELLYIDFEKDSGEVIPAPAGSGSWTVIEVPGDRLVVGTFYDGSFMIFDLKARKFAKVVKFPGESYIWNLVRGSDGRVYGGTYPNGKLGAINPESGQFEDLGAPAPPNQYLRWVSAAPWGQVFANFGQGKATTKVYDISSKSWKDVPGLKEGETFGVGVSWNGVFVAMDTRSGRIQAFGDAALQPIAESPLNSAEAAGFAIESNLSGQDRLFLTKGTALYRADAGQKEFKPIKLADLDLRGGRYIAAARDSRLLGVRGQSYFVLKPGDTDLALKPMPVESRGRPSLFLEADDQGRIWGGPHFGQTLFYLDTRTGKAVNTETICDAGGEVYDVAFHKGRVFAASYAGGDITCFDPAVAWDQWNGKNPKPLAKVGPGYIRPIAGIMTSPDGMLCAGWMAKYGTYGGAVSMTDPENGKTEMIENPLGPQAIASLAVDGQFLYIGTGLDANGLPHQKPPSKFGVVDRKSRKVVFEAPFDTASVTRMVVEPKTARVAFTVGGKLHVYDPIKREVATAPIQGLSPLTGSRLLAVGDGTLLASAEKKLLRLDLAAGSYAVWLEAPVVVENATIGADNKVYFSNGADLYRTEKTIR